MYRGVLYRVTCEQLGLPRQLWTREGSYRAANARWAAKKQELDGDGKPWYSEAIVDGKLEKRDGIYNAFDWLRRKLAARGKKLERSLKELRKTGSTLLEMDASHSRFGEYFRGHSGGNVRSLHYLDMKQLQPQFDKAVAFNRPGAASSDRR
jgi:hypothetical protein